MRERIESALIRSTIVVGLVTGMAFAMPARAAAQNAATHVAPPTATLHGLTAGEWSARWWKWALETPASQNPLIDETGINCAVNQTGRVWFLAGLLGSGEVTRSCTVPEGTSLFFPVANAFCVPDPGTTGTFEDQRACASAFIATLISMQAELDGVSIPNLSSYRALSPAFALDFPEDDIFGVHDVTLQPAAADGFYLTVRPLPPGTHTIHVRAEFSTGEPGVTQVIDVTYNITVA